MIIGGMNPNDTVAGAGPAAGLQANALPGPPLPTGATLLADWGLIRARGEDAATFLQGQLTNDVARLADGAVRLAGYCSPKGRLLASFLVWRTAADEFLLACSADLLAPTLKRLSMYVLRARCKLTDATAEFSLWGVLGGTAAGAAWQVRQDQQAWWVRLPDALGQPRHLVAAPAGSPAPAGLPPLSEGAWRWAEVRSGVVRIVAATVEHFVPQMVNFELVGGVDFQKGCYPGQEVVARSQYRGTLKRRAVLLACSQPLAEGSEVYHDADPGQPAGTVALAASFGGHHAALVELKRAALQDGALHAGAVDGPRLQPLPLPYPLPQDDA